MSDVTGDCLRCGVEAPSSLRCHVDVADKGDCSATATILPQKAPRR